MYVCMYTLHWYCRSHSSKNLSSFCRIKNDMLLLAIALPQTLIIIFKYNIPMSNACRWRYIDMIIVIIVIKECY